MADEVLARRRREGQLDVPSRPRLPGHLAAPHACMPLLPMAWNASGDAIELAAIAVGGLCLAFAFLAIMTDARRHARRDDPAPAGRALRPLDPSAEEIEADPRVAPPGPGRRSPRSSGPATSPMP